MNILYTSGYKNRFKKVITVIKNYQPKSVLELCFGDVFIAKYCTENNIDWTGIDINEHFVRKLKNKGYNATRADLSELIKLPKADICLMMGSLYHFHNETHSILSKMLNAANVIIISEPIKNISDQNNFIGRFAKKSANASKGNEAFRYNANSLEKMLTIESNKLNFKFEIVDFYKKDSIIVIEKNGNN